MEETKVEVNAVEEKPAKRPYNRQKKTETEAKVETVEVKKDAEPIKVEVAEETAKTEVKVANEAKPKEAKAEEKKAEVKAEVNKEGVAEEPAKEAEKKEEIKAEEPAKPAETKDEATAILSIEKPEIEPDKPELKASYLIKRPIPIYYTPKVTIGSKWFVGVVRVLDKVDDKFVKVAYKDSGSGATITAYILTSSLPQ